MGDRVVNVQFVSGDAIEVSVPTDPTANDFSQQLAMKCGGRRLRIFKDGEELRSEQHIGSLLSGATLSGVQLCDDALSRECPHLRLSWACLPC